MAEGVAPRARRRDGGGGHGVAVPAPLTGRVVPLDQVPDPVFAERMVGDGAAVLPEDGGTSGRLVLVATAPGQAARVAAASLTEQVAVTLRA